VAVYGSPGKLIAVSRAWPYLFQDCDWDRRLAELGSSIVMIGMLFVLLSNEPSEPRRRPSLRTGKCAAFAIACARAFAALVLSVIIAESVTM